MSRRPHTEETRWAPLVLLLAAAFALRILYIDQQSIWYDEALSIYYARSPIADLLVQVSASDHPPLHTLLLHAWMSLCGDSELAVRLLSTYWAMLSVALLYRLARSIMPDVRFTSALLMAVSPLAVWYAQETRGYTLALALSLAAVVVAFRLLDARARPSLGHYAAYVALAAASLYSHFYAGFVLLALNVAYLALNARGILSRSQARAALAWWSLAQALVIAFVSPWVPFVVRQLSENATYWHGAVGWQQIIGQTVTAFSVGETLTDGWALAGTAAMSTLALLGSMALARHDRDRPFLVLSWAWMVVPATLVIAINLTRPKFSPRYLLNALPPFLVLAAAGARHLFDLARRRASGSRGWPAIALLLLTTGLLGGATTRSLANHYFNERLYRPDFRAVARYIERHASKQDLIVLVGGHSYPALSYYYRGSLPVLALPGKLLPDTRAPVGLSALDELNRAIVGRQQLWLVLWQSELADPTGLIVDELEQNYHRLGVGETFHDLALLAFDVSPGPRLESSLGPQAPMRTTLGTQIRFLGYDLPAESARPGETLYLYLYWQAEEQVRHDYKVFAQILDPENRIIAQQDKIAGAEAYPTSHWLPGYTVRDRLLVTIRADAGAGLYRLVAGLYSPGGDMARLPVEGEGSQGDHILLTEIKIR